MKLHKETADLKAELVKLFREAKAAEERAAEEKEEEAARAAEEAEKAKAAEVPEHVRAHVTQA